MLCAMRLSSVRRERMRRICVLEGMQRFYPFMTV